MSNIPRGTLLAHQEWPGTTAPGTDLAKHVRKLVEEAPPLSEEQRARLRVLLRPCPAEGQHV